MAASTQQGAIPSDSYDRFDRLRKTLVGDKQQYLPNEDSSVVEVPDDQSPDKSFRMIHIACALGLSRSDAPVFDSFDQAKAALMAQYHFNNRVESVVPNLRQLLTNPEDGRECNLKLTLDMFDTERNPAVGARLLVEDIYKLPFPYKPTAMIGAERSAVSAPMAILNSAKEIPQFSHSATSTTFSDRGPFSYFGRVIPSSTGDAQAGIEYFTTTMKTTHLGIAYVDDEYGLAYRVALERAASEANVRTIAVGITYQTSVEVMRHSVSKAADFMAQSGFRHFMGVLFTEQLELLLEIGVERGIMGPGRVWLFGDGIFSGAVKAWRFPTNSPQARALHGTGILTVGASTVDGSYDRFLDAFRKQEETPDFREYFAQKSPLFTDVVTFDSNYNTSVPSDFSELLYDAVMAIGIAGCRSQNPYFTGQELFSEFIESQFSGASGFVRIDPTTGARRYSSVTYVILNTRVGESTDDPGMTQNDVVLAAEFTESIVDNEIVASWTKPNDNAFFQFSDSTNNPPNPLPPREISDVISTPVYGIIAGFAGLVMLGSLGFAVWTWIHRDSHIVRVSQPSFLLLICLGVFLMGAAVITSGIVSPPMSAAWAEHSCMTNVWLSGIGFSLIFAALYTKTKRINKIFNCGASFRRIRVGAQDVAAPGFVLVFANLCLTAIWQGTDPLRYELKFDSLGSVDAYERPLEITSMCNSENGTGIYFLGATCLLMGLTIFAAMVEAYKARHITTEYSESSYIALSTLANLQGLVLLLPIFFFISNPQTTYIARSCIVLLIATTTLVLIFAPKVWHRTEHERLKKQRAEEKRLRLAASALLCVDKMSEFVRRDRDQQSFAEHDDTDRQAPVVSDAEANPRARVVIHHELTRFRGSLTSGCHEGRSSSMRASSTSRSASIHRSGGNFRLSQLTIRESVRAASRWTSETEEIATTTRQRRHPNEEFTAIEDEPPIQTTVICGNSNHYLSLTPPSSPPTGERNFSALSLDDVGDEELASNATPTVDVVMSPKVFRALPSLDVEDALPTLAVFVPETGDGVEASPLASLTPLKTQNTGTLQLDDLAKPLDGLSPHREISYSRQSSSVVPDASVSSCAAEETSISVSSPRRGLPFRTEGHDASRKSNATADKDHHDDDDSPGHHNDDDEEDYEYLKEKLNTYLARNDSLPPDLSVSSQRSDDLLGDGLSTRTDSFDVISLRSGSATNIMDRQTTEVSFQ